MTGRAAAPWSVLANSWQYTTIYDANKTPLCRLDLEDWGVTEDNQDALETEQTKVARLIVAAPEMLAALKQAVAAFRVYTHDDQALLNTMRDAIAKAEA